ncbi:MAG: VWA domain-containing protein, partial [Burkholderiaceae bacterium]
MGNPTSFTFLWPSMLWLLLAVPLVMFVYAQVLKRRSASLARHARLETVGAATTGRVQRALPPLLWLLGLTMLLLAVARPQAALVLPARIETIILAVDMSGSMRATDLQPTRMVAAQNAAKAFVADQPRHVKIGVVGIAASAALVQPPTDNREAIITSIDRLEPQRGTALGSGLVIALDAALPQARINVEEFINPPKGKKDEPRKKLEEREITAGSNSTAAIVLLSDGQSNVGPDPMKAAELAAELGVRVYTVGMGTPEGTTVSADGWQMRVRLDEEKLKQIARVTEGEYFRAPDAKELKQV